MFLCTDFVSGFSQSRSSSCPPGSDSVTWHTTYGEALPMHVAAHIHTLLYAIYSPNGDGSSHRCTERKDSARTIASASQDFGVTTLDLLCCTWCIALWMYLQLPTALPLLPIPTRTIYPNRLSLPKLMHANLKHNI